MPSLNEAMNQRFQIRIHDIRLSVVNNITREGYFTLYIIEIIIKKISFKLFYFILKNEITFQNDSLIN
jgi:hypothetical protein